MTIDTGTSRRTFLKASAGTLSVAALASAIGTQAFAQEGVKPIRFVVVGSGGRGIGAAYNLFEASIKNNFPVKLVALADAFEDSVKGAAEGLKNDASVAKYCDLPADRLFHGLDSYKKAIDVDCDLVVIASPPGFKPQQFEYAVQKGRHVFMEKPVAVDAPGTRRCMVANDMAKAKNLLVAIGLQRRHEGKYMSTVKALQDGAIGDINLLRVYWNGGGIWYRNKYPNINSMKHQVDNWYHFIWACGDQICEQHIHNIDVGCWIKGAYPTSCNGMGGAEMRMGGTYDKSQIFDHTFCEYVFADGTRMYSQGRHVANTWSPINEYAHGSKGWSCPGNGSFTTGKYKVTVPYDTTRVGGHQQEQTDLIAKLSKGEIYNEGDYGINSTFAAILGREACYSGAEIKWKDLLEKGKDYCPGIDTWTLDSIPPCQLDDKGKLPVPRPGNYKIFA